MRQILILLFSWCLITVSQSGNAATLFVSNDTMQYCAFNEPADMFEQCCFDRAVDYDEMSDTQLQSLNAGRSSCPSGMKKNARGECKPIRNLDCIAGQYLPAHANECTDCKEEKYICLGGNFSIQSYDQGLTECPEGQVADETKTVCVEKSEDNESKKTNEKPSMTNNNITVVSQDLASILQSISPNTSETTIHCNAGQYLPAGATYCQICKETYYVCPGGDFTKQSFNQGMVMCQDGKVANSSKTECINVADMTQEEACKYMGGDWNSDKTLCLGSIGNIWRSEWDSKNKTFKCINSYEYYLKQNNNDMTNQTVRTWKWALFTGIIKNGNYNTLKLQPFVSNLQWDKTKKKCTSSLERKCYEIGGEYNFNTYECNTMKSTPENACRYFGGTWEANKCTMSTGSGKSRFVLDWNNSSKRFDCLNMIEASKKYPENKNYASKAEKEKSSIYDAKGNTTPKYADAKWDVIIQECASRSERVCRDFGGAWDFSDASCYEYKKNKSACENVGAKFKVDTAGVEYCDCKTDDREFHYASNNNACEYKIKVGAKAHKQGTAGGVSSTQYPTVETCIMDLKKIDFFDGKTKLNCQ